MDSGMNNKNRIQKPDMRNNYLE